MNNVDPDGPLQHEDKPYAIMNDGTGGTPFLNFLQNPDGFGTFFTQECIDQNHTAAILIENNVFGMARGRLFGKVVWLSLEVFRDTHCPKIGTIQKRGMARFKYDPKHRPILDSGVIALPDGRVGWTSSATLQDLRGSIICIEEDKEECVIWLG